MGFFKVQSDTYVNAMRLRALERLEADEINRRNAARDVGPEAVRALRYGGPNAGNTSRIPGASLEQMRAFQEEKRAQEARQIQQARQVQQAKQLTGGTLKSDPKTGSAAGPLFVKPLQSPAPSPAPSSAPPPAPPPEGTENFEKIITDAHPPNLNIPVVQQQHARLQHISVFNRKIEKIKNGLRSLNRKGPAVGPSGDIFDSTPKERADRVLVNRFDAWLGTPASKVFLAKNPQILAAMRKAANPEFIFKDMNLGVPIGPSASRDPAGGATGLLAPEVVNNLITKLELVGKEQVVVEAALKKEGITDIGIRQVVARLFAIEDPALAAAAPVNRTRGVLPAKDDPTTEQIIIQNTGRPITREITPGLRTSSPTAALLKTSARRVDKLRPAPQNMSYGLMAQEIRTAEGIRNGLLARARMLYAANDPGFLDAAILVNASTTVIENLAVQQALNTFSNSGDPRQLSRILSIQRGMNIELGRNRDGTFFERINGVTTRTNLTRARILNRQRRAASTEFSAAMATLSATRAATLADAEFEAQVKIGVEITKGRYKLLVEKFKRSGGKIHIGTDGNTYFVRGGRTVFVLKQVELPGGGVTDKFVHVPVPSPNIPGSTHATILNSTGR